MGDVALGSMRSLNPTLLVVVGGRGQSPTECGSNLDHNRSLELICVLNF